uniref:Uncharacterized protein n=1 Tax=Anguilla anguilla TaxID=7936 RepID=A0A0E9S6D8_ANGAN
MHLPHRSTLNVHLWRSRSF